MFGIRPSEHCPWFPTCDARNSWKAIDTLLAGLGWDTPVSGDVSYDFSGLMHVTFELFEFHGYGAGVTFEIVETLALSHLFNQATSSPYILYAWYHDNYPVCTLFARLNFFIAYCAVC